MLVFNKEFKLEVQLLQPCKCWLIYHFLHKLAETSVTARHKGESLSRGSSIQTIRSTRLRLLRLLMAEPVPMSPPVEFIFSLLLIKYKGAKAEHVLMFWPPTPVHHQCLLHQFLLLHCPVRHCPVRLAMSSHAFQHPCWVFFKFVFFYIFRFCFYVAIDSVDGSTNRSGSLFLHFVHTNADRYVNLMGENLYPPCKKQTNKQTK